MNSTNVTCPECKYDKPRNMGTHLFFVHGYSKNRISEWRMNMKADLLSRSPTVYDIFRCGFCPKTYRRQNSCRAHERVVHCVSSNMRQKCVPCPVRNCVFSTTALLDLCAHAQESHSEMGDFSIREARFENITLFQAWRLQYEENTQTVLATESVNSNAAAGTTLRYLRCAQLEAQIRKVRTQMRQAEARTNGGLTSTRNHGEEGQEDQMQEQLIISSTPINTPRRSVRKRTINNTDESDSQKVHKGFISIHKQDKKNENEEENEEEEVDVEQLDDGEEAKPCSSAFSLFDNTSPSKAAFDDSKNDEHAPPLLRANLRGDDAVSDQDDDEQPAEAEQLQQQRISSRHCTAHMRVLVLGTGAVSVEWCASHLGHEVIPIPPASRSSDNRSERAIKVKPMATIPREIEEDMERAKQRRKGRRETEHRWRTEKRMRTERDEFAQLCNRYDDIGANVELYEADDVFDEELPVEEVIEEDMVDREELATSDD